MLASLGKEQIDCYVFGDSARISTYLYCVCAGAYDSFEPSESTKDEKIPM